jgi:carbonic anhydrase
MRMRLVLLMMALVIYDADAESSSEESNSWGYDADNGPNTWVGLCATGQHQSPINIVPTQLVSLETTALRFVNYNITGAVNLQNTGRVITVFGFADWQQRPSVSGGGLSGDYDLVQFHFHWSHIDDDGSEHRLSLLHYPLEAHLVHLKRGLSIDKALEQPDGLAVIAVFFAKADNDSAALPLQPIETALTSTVALNAIANVTQFRTKQLLPSSTEMFYRYAGSLTTPSCSEAVVWTLLAEPLLVSSNQLEMFRRHLDPHGNEMRDNRRPVMPLNGRKVYFRGSSASLFPAACTIVMICMPALFYNF